MKKRDYFLLALKHKSYLFKAWTINCFSVVRTPGEEYPCHLLRGERHYSFIHPETSEEIIIVDSHSDVPLFNFKETVNVSKGDLPNIHGDIETTYGKLVVNAVALVYPFGDKIEYQNGEFKIKNIEKIIEKRLTSDPKYKGPKSIKVEAPIYVTEYLNFIDAVLSLEGYTQLCVPSATAKTMTRDPRVPELRARLLEEHKDSLNDPATIAKIDAELVKMDREWMKGDLGEGFYIKDKSYEVVRKKVHLMHGYEQGFGESPATITNSLSEGWDLEKMPAMVNSLREGSYNRGAQTQLGGVAAKTINRIFQNTRIAEDDCGSTLGMDHFITDSNKGHYLGFYAINGKKLELLSDVNIDQYVGKEVTLRSPMYCKTSRANFCRTCMGEINSESETALASLASGVGSTLLNTFMKLMHGTALKTTTYVVEDTIS